MVAVQNSRSMQIFLPLNYDVTKVIWCHQHLILIIWLFFSMLLRHLLIVVVAGKLELNWIDSSNSNRNPTHKIIIGMRMLLLLAFQIIVASRRCTNGFTKFNNQHACFNSQFVFTFKLNDSHFVNGVRICHCWIYKSHSRDENEAPFVLSNAKENNQISSTHTNASNRKINRTNIPINEMKPQSNERTGKSKWLFCTYANKN